MAKKATAHDAQLILKLYELRREAEMRKARHWFTAEFWPETADDFLKVANAFPSQENSWLRQVSSYWDTWQHRWCCRGRCTKSCLCSLVAALKCSSFLPRSIHF